MATRPFRRQLVRILNIGEYTWMLIDYDYLGSPLFKLMLCFFFFSLCKIDLRIFLSIISLAVLEYPIPSVFVLFCFFLMEGEKATHQGRLS